MDNILAQKHVHSIILIQNKQIGPKTHSEAKICVRSFQHLTKFKLCHTDPNRWEAAFFFFFFHWELNILVKSNEVVQKLSPFLGHGARRRKCHLHVGTSIQVCVLHVLLVAHAYQSLPTTGFTSPPCKQTISPGFPDTQSQSSL